jgi:phosphoglycerate dehydrogenase-like enzyme
MASSKQPKKRVLLDPAGRKMREIFNDEDLESLRTWFDVVWAKDEPIPLEAFEREKNNLFAVVCCGWRFGGVEEMPELRVILEVGGGLPNPSRLDYATCFKRGIRVLSCAPAFGPMVAEMCLAMALDCTREVSLGDRLFRAGAERYLHVGNEHTFTLYRRRVGFVGFGGLARNLKPLLEPFQCSISVYDPWLTESYLRGFGVTPGSLEEIMAESDVIFVLAVPTSGNKSMISRRHLELIKPHRVFVLMSRSHVVDFDALTDLVVRGRFKAAIDVFPEEPLPKGHPIRKAESAVLSAHRAGSVEEDLRLIGRMVAEDLEAMNAGLPPQRMQRAEPELVFRL